jgi:branched-chain amino acid transport system substrate-binding protein
MANKNNNETKILIFSLLITTGLIGGGAWWFFNRFNSNGSAPISINNNANQSSIDTRMSAGESLLITDETNANKELGIKAFAEGNFPEAIANLQASLTINRNDPESLIYLNNARIGNNQSYSIVAASVPIGVEKNVAKEILRGVAQAQNGVNSKGGINGVPLKVIIANDDNDPKIAQELAQEFVKNPEILGVIGHFGSDTTIAASQIYQNSGLVLISPTSTSVKISGIGSYIFRTVPSDRFAGNSLAQYMLTQLKVKKAAVFYNSQSDYSISLKDVFTTTVFGEGGEIVSEYDLSQSNFNPANHVIEATQRGAEVIMLAPNSATLDQALQVVKINQRKLPILAGDSVYQPKTLEVGKDLSLGIIIAVPWHVLSNPNSPFVQTANNLWGGDVNWRTTMAYDATEALIAAISKNPTRQGVQQALSDANFIAQGGAGNIRFLPSGDRNQAVQLVTVVTGNRSGFGYDFIPVP